MVELIHSPESVKTAVARARSAGQRIGLVPTMGALHEGHSTLIRVCGAGNDLVVMSLFVNPTQFGPGEDFERYPRTLEDDLRKADAAGAHLVFAPSVPTIYPHTAPSTFVEVPGLSEILEGASRPGHFRGVATVVLKLLEIVRPDLAYFGQKDFQQQLIIRRMVEDLHLPVRIETIPTVREPDGLALSSRNRYLNARERAAAPVIFHALEHARTAAAAGERDVGSIRQILAKTLQSQPLVQPDYLEIRDAHTLDPLEYLSLERRAVVLIAAKIGSTRLLDNALLTVGGPR